MVQSATIIGAFRCQRVLSEASKTGVRGDAVPISDVLAPRMHEVFGIRAVKDGVA